MREETFKNYNLKIMEATSEYHRTMKPALEKLKRVHIKAWSIYVERIIEANNSIDEN